MFLSPAATLILLGAFVLAGAALVTLGGIVCVAARRARRERSTRPLP